MSGLGKAWGNLGARERGHITSVCLPEGGWADIGMESLIIIKLESIYRTLLCHCSKHFLVAATRSLLGGG